MTIEEKKIKIGEIAAEQKKLLAKVKRITKCPPAKRSGTTLRRAVKVVSIGLQLTSLQRQKKVIAAIPTLKPGAPPRSGIAVVEEGFKKNNRLPLS